MAVLTQAGVEPTIEQKQNVGGLIENQSSPPQLFGLLDRFNPRKQFAAGLRLLGFLPSNVATDIVLLLVNPFGLELVLLFKPRNAFGLALSGTRSNFPDSHAPGRPPLQESG